MKALVGFFVLGSINILSRIFFRFSVEWVGPVPQNPFGETRIGVLLNHTSLFEPILSALFPWPFVWAVSTRGLMPGADATLERPIAGRIFKFMVPGIVSVTRARDKSWEHFLSLVTEESVVLIAPEGRMKRRTGLDKHGKPMNLRGGIVDILERKTQGTMLLFYSEGLHHVQVPGEGFPHLFVRIRARLEEILIERYKKEMGHGTPEFRDNVLRDLESRRDRHCPWG